MSLVKHTQNYTTMSNELIRSKVLSFGAVGMYLFINSKIDGWDFSYWRIANEKNEENKEKNTTKYEVEKLCKDLKRLGLLVQIPKQIILENGKKEFNGYEWHLYDEIDTERVITGRSKSTDPLDKARREYATDNKPENNKPENNKPESIPPTPKGGVATKGFDYIEETNKQEINEAVKIDFIEWFSNKSKRDRTIGSFKRNMKILLKHNENQQLHILDKAIKSSYKGLFELNQKEIDAIANKNEVLNDTETITIQNLSQALNISNEALNKESIQQGLKNVAQYLNNRSKGKIGIASFKAFLSALESNERVIGNLFNTTTLGGLLMKYESNMAILEMDNNNIRENNKDNREVITYSHYWSSNDLVEKYGEFPEESEDFNQKYKFNN